MYFETLLNLRKCVLKIIPAIAFSSQVVWKILDETELNCWVDLFLLEFTGSLKHSMNPKLLKEGDKICRISQTYLTIKSFIP